MTKKDSELFEMMRGFKTLSAKEQGFVLGLVEGMTLCKKDSEPHEYINKTKKQKAV